MSRRMEAHQAVLVAHRHPGGGYPRAERSGAAVAAEGIEVKVYDQVGRAVGALLQFIEHPKIGWLHEAELIALQVEEAKIVQAAHLEVEVPQIVVAQMEVTQRGQVAEDIAILEVRDLVLLQMQLLQLYQLAVHKDVVQILAQLRRAIVLKGIGEMQTLQINEVREDAWVMVIHLVLVPRDAQIVVVENQALHARHMVIALAANLADVIAAHVHDAQLLVVVDAAKDIPRQLSDPVAREDQHLHLFGHKFQHAGVHQSCVRAVHHVLHLAFVHFLAATARRRKVRSAAGGIFAQDAACADR